MFVQLLSVLRHLDALLGECWFCQSWRLSVLGLLWGISPGSTSKGECGGVSAAGFDEIGWRRKDWGLWALYGGGACTPDSWRWKLININVPQAGWLVLWALWKMLLVWLRGLDIPSAILGQAPRCALEKEPVLAPMLAISVVDSPCNQDFIRGVILTSINHCTILSLTARLPEAFSCRCTISVGFSNVS